MPDITTLDLLKKFGHRKVKFRSRKSPTFQEAWDSTSNPNERFQIRLDLLRLAGYIS